MVGCFLCGSTNSVSNGGLKQLRSLQPKSSDSMKCVLNNLVGDSGLTACDKDVVCQNCEVLCRELDVMEYERLTMRKILRRLIHNTYQVNNLDRNLCHLDHKALGQFKLNGTCYYCKKCDFKTKRFAHITPHHTIHQIQSRRALEDVKLSSDTSSESSSSSIKLGPLDEREDYSFDKPSSWEEKNQGNEIFEFNIDSHEGDCLYSIEDVSVKISGKEKNDEFEYDLYYPEDCENEKTEKLHTDSRKRNLKTDKEGRGCSITKNIKNNNQDTRCPRLNFLYAMHCGCSHCEQLPPNHAKLNSQTKAKKEPNYKCATCKQNFLQESTYRLHERWCRIKSALKYHATSEHTSTKNLRCKNIPHCSKWLDEKRRVCVDDEDDFYDLGAVNIDATDLEGNLFDEKFESFLRKTLGLNTIDLEFVPI